MWVAQFGGYIGFPRAAIIQYHKLSDINRDLFFYGSRSQKSKIQMLAELVLEVLREKHPHPAPPASGGS